MAQGSATGVVTPEPGIAPPNPHPGPLPPAIDRARYEALSAHIVSLLQLPATGVLERDEMATPRQEMRIKEFAPKIHAALREYMGDPALASLAQEYDRSLTAFEEVVFDPRSAEQAATRLREKPRWGAYGASLVISTVGFDPYHPKGPLLSSELSLRIADWEPPHPSTPLQPRAAPGTARWDARFP